MTASEFGMPPVNVAVPHTGQTIATIVWGLIGIAVVVVAAIRWRRTRSPLMMLYIVGAALATAQEPFLDIGARVWYATRGGQLALFTTMNHTTPVWALFVYMVWFGAFPVLFAVCLRRRPKASTFWLFLAGVAVGNLLVEIPLIQIHLYRYFAPQGLTIGGFPPQWILINFAGVALSAALLVRFEPALKGARVLWVLLLPAATQLAASSLAIPGVLFGSANHPSDALVVAGQVLSAGIALVVLGALLRLVLSWLGADTESPAHADPRPEAAPHALRPLATA